MWILIFLFILILSAAGFAFVASRMMQFPFLRTLPRKKALLLSVLLLFVLMLLITLWSGLWNAMIVFIHLLLIWLLCEGCAALIARLRKKPSVPSRTGAAAIFLTVAILTVGYFCLHHVSRTAYTIETGKDLGVSSLRIVGFSDSHMGTVFRADRLLDYVERMNAEEPDVVVIVGDFADDDTSYEEMAESCQALSRLKTKYGVYYVFGNHDCGYYSSRRGYGKEELVQNLEQNRVIVLEDGIVPLAGNVVLFGRQDAGQRDRMSMDTYAALAPENSYTVVLDHQPNDYAAQEAAGVDLVLSGHTHGGQFFPINRAGEWIGANDMTYGIAERGSTRFLVSSGIANWAFQFKTGCISEYFVIDVVSAS